MRTSDQIDQIATALAAAQSEMRPAKKSGENKHARYEYATLLDYDDAWRGLLSRHGLALSCSCSGEAVDIGTRETRGGGVYYRVRVHVTARLVHVSGQWIEAYAYGDGEDNTDKAIYKAITGGRKYAIAAVLGLATSDDPERDQQEQYSPRRRVREEPATDEQLAVLREYEICDDISEATRRRLGELLESSTLTKEKAQSVIEKCKGMTK